MSLTHSGVQVRTLDIVQDGDTFYKTTQDEKTGAARAYTGFDANSTIITSILPGSDPSVQSGLNLTQTYLGYYNGAEWKSYMNIDGHFYLGGVDGSLQWNGSSLLIGGDSQLIFGTRIIPGTNILSPDVRLWEETTTPSGIGYWTEGSNPYGSGDESNSIISSLNPFGHQDLVWECNVVSGAEKAGGWAYNTFDIDKTLRYRHTIWAKFIGGIGRDMFFGCGNTGHTSDLTLDDSDSVNNDPYFASGLELPNAIHFNDNPVANPSMELTTNWSGYGNPITSQRSAADSFDGTYSWYCDLFEADVGSGTKSDEFTLEGYQTYRFSIWLKANDKTTKWQIYIDNGEQRYWIKEFGHENSYISYDDWTNHVVTFQTAERSTTNRIYIVASEVDTTAAIYIDAVEVSTQLIVNGHMDDGFTFGERFTGWVHVGNPSYCATSNEQAHSGTYSRKVIAQTSGDGTKTSKYNIARGSCTETAAGKVVDSNATFIDAGVAVNDLIYNMGGGGTYVTAINSGTELSVNDDIFVYQDSYSISSDRSYLKMMAGYQYRASMWLYGDNATEWVAKVSDGVTDYDFLETDNTPLLVPSGIWTQYMIDFEAENNTEEGYLSVTCSGVSGTLYIDDVEFQETPWYLLTGFVHPDNYIGPYSWGNLYHYKTGYSPATYSGIDYKSLDATTVQGFRCFQKNSDDDEENHLLLYSPAIHVVDGSEPSLSAVLGNSLNMAWNVEHTTSISKYLLSSPTIRGGNYAGGNYVQMDAYGLRGFGAGINTFTLDSLTGNVTIKSSDSGKRIEISGTDNTLKFYDGVNTNPVVWIDDDVTPSSNIPGILVQNDNSDYTMLLPGTVFIHNEDDSEGGLFNYTALLVSNEVSIDLNTYSIYATLENTSADTYGRDRHAVYADSSITNAANDSIPIGIYARAGTNNTSIDAIAGKFQSNEIQIRLTYGDAAARTDLMTDNAGRLNIIPSGDIIRLWESGEDTNDYADLYVDTSGILNIQPGGTGAAQTGKLRLWDATGTAGDYVDMYSDGSGSLRIDPGGLGTNITSINAAVGAAMIITTGQDTTAHGAGTEDQIMGWRINNTSATLGTQCGIHFNTSSAYAGIFGLRGSGTNEQGLAFYTEDTTRSVKFAISHDGNLEHKDILYPEITTGGTAAIRTWTVDVMDMSSTVTSRIGDTAGIGGESTRGVVEWWVSWSEFGAPESIGGGTGITFAVTTGTAHGSVVETSRNVATTNSSGRVIITATTANSSGATNVWLHVRIGAGICYSEEATINTVT